VWFRGIFMLDPHPALMAGAPLIYQMHATAAWFLFALWPFSRLVHAWSVPVAYLGRAHLLYRGRRHVIVGRQRVRPVHPGDVRTGSAAPQDGEPQDGEPQDDAAAITAGPSAQPTGAGWP
jgi:nitrate reductase gamma subunit